MSEFNKTIRSLKGARNVAAAVGLLDSAYGIFAASYGQTVQMWGMPWLAFLTASLVTVLVAYLVDWGLHANSLTAMRGILREPAANVSPSFYWWVGVLCIIQFSFGILSAVYTRPFAVDAVTVAPVVESAADAQERATAATTAQVAALDADIARIQKERNAALLVAGSVTMREMAANGNKWAQNQLNARKSKISAQYAKQLDAVTAAKTTLLTTATATTAATVGSITADNAAKWGNYVGKKGSLNWVLLGITLLCSAVFLLTTTILAQYDDAPVTNNAQQNAPKPKPQRTKQRPITDNDADSRYNVDNDATDAQQRTGTPVTEEHLKTKFEDGQYHVFLYTPDGGARWYNEKQVNQGLNARKSQVKNSPTDRKDLQLVERWRDIMAAGVATVRAIKTQNAGA